MRLPGLDHLLELLASGDTHDGRQHEHERVDAGGDHYLCDCVVYRACEEDV